MVRPQFADGRIDVFTRRVGTKTANKQLRTAEKGWPPSEGLREILIPPPPN